MLGSIIGWISKKRWWIVIVLIALAVVVYSQSKKQVTPVVTVTPIVQPITETLQLSGSVDAEDKASIPYGSGLISWVGVKNDQVVKKWQAVAKMDTRSLEKQLNIDLNNFDKQFRTHDQLLDDKKYYDSGTNINSSLRRILENANYDLNNAVLAVEIRDLAIKMSTLSTPIEGVVTRIDKPYSGVFSGPADTIQVVNPKTIYFAAVVDETDVGKVIPDQKVNVVLDAFPDKTFTSTVSKIDFTPSTSRSGGVGYKIHIALTDGDILSQVRLSMNGTATITLKEKSEVLTIPTNAGINRDGKTYVDIKTGKIVTRREITTGLETDQILEVTSGLAKTDTIVVPSSTGK